MHVMQQLLYLHKVLSFWEAKSTAWLLYKTTALLMAPVYPGMHRAFQLPFSCICAAHTVPLLLCAHKGRLQEGHTHFWHCHKHLWCTGLGPWADKPGQEGETDTVLLKLGSSSGTCIKAASLPCLQSNWQAPRIA